MAVTLERMGRQKSEKGTDVIRVDADLAHMLGIIQAVMGGTTAERVSPLIREQVVAWFAEASKKMEEMRRASNKKEGR